MTAVAEDLDLEAIFRLDSAGDPDDSCDGYEDESPCPAEPVVATHWKQECACGKSVEYQCARHRDQIRAHMARYGRQFRCAECDARAWLIRMEPVR